MIVYCRFVGVHYLKHLDGTLFGAYVWGEAASVCTYAYPAGQCMKDLVSNSLLHIMFHLIKDKYNVLDVKHELTCPFFSCRHLLLMLQVSMQLESILLLL